MYSMLCSHWMVPISWINLRLCSISVFVFFSICTHTSMLMSPIKVVVSLRFVTSLYSVLVAGNWLFYIYYFKLGRTVVDVCHNGAVGTRARACMHVHTHTRECMHVWENERMHITNQHICWKIFERMTQLML